ncbi:MAG TPA: hypothetical protein VM942_07690 [Acidimicrobiales bacterium]|nr:hypothetical protein [Acidimicrobiales bacterium]
MRDRVGAMSTVAVGALVSGAASVGGLALATRALGTVRVGPLAVAWTLAVVAGPGLWSSVEQEAARATARREAGALGRLVLRRSAIAAGAAAILGLAARGAVFGGSVAVPLALAAVAAAYGPLHLAWGRLAGARRSRALAATVAVEGMARLVLVGGTAAMTHEVGPSAWALAGAVASAAVVATAAAGVGERGAEDRGTKVGAAGRIRSLTWAGLLSQGLFLGSPAAFELLARAGDPRTARLAMAVVLARAPALAWKGVLTAVVPAFAANCADSGTAPRASAAVARAVVIGTVVAAVVGVAAAVVLGDAVLDVLTGPGPALGAVALGLLALATAAYLGALTATSALAGAGRARAAASAWLAGAATAIAAVMVPGDPLRRVVVALAAGTLMALTAVVWACVRRSRATGC